MIFELEEAAMTVLSNRYKLMQKLGQNPGRQTWLAQDLQTEQSVVVKQLTFNSDMRWSDFKLFEREAQLLKSLEHSAIPQYLNYLDLEEPEQQGFALVQEYIPAQSLQQHMKSGRVFTQSDVEVIAKDLLEILTYLHNLRPPVIHRDIKPSNILLGDRSGNSPGKVYLIDFDSVQTFVRTDSSVTIAGTYGYMPFEQFQGQATPVSDLYSLGVTLIHLVTGESPTPDLNLKIQFESSRLHPIFASWLTWLTQINPNERPKDAKVALAALKGIQLQTEVRQLNPGKWIWNDLAWVNESKLGLQFSLPAQFRRLETNKVKLRINKDFIKICASPEGNLSAKITLLCSGLIVGGFSLLIGALYLFLIIESLRKFDFIGLSVILICLPFPIVFALFSMLMLNQSSSWEELHIDRKRITRRRGFMCFWRSESHPIGNIQELTYALGFPGNSTGDGMGKSPLLPCVALWFPEGYAYKIEGYGLTNKDTKYLAQVLSNWLRMPINP